MDGMILFSNSQKIKIAKLKNQSTFHVIMNSHEILEGCKIIFRNNHDKKKFLAKSVNLYTH